MDRELRWCPEMALYCGCDKRCKDLKNVEQGQLLIIDDVAEPVSPEKLKKALQWFYDNRILKKWKPNGNS